MCRKEPGATWAMQAQGKTRHAPLPSLLQADQDKLPPKANRRQPCVGRRKAEAYGPDVVRTLLFIERALAELQVHILGVGELEQLGKTLFTADT